MSKKRILLKITGEIFLKNDTKDLSATAVTHVIEQLKALQDTHLFGIVIGGGNFFRGDQQGKHMGLRPAISHQIGMLGTMMNGLMFKDLCEKYGIASELFCALPSPEIGKPISDQAITSSIQKDHTLIFTGGTGNPFFTTDTTAIVRALQMNAHEVWKGTTVSGIYTNDPDKDPHAKRLDSISYNEAINKKLSIMDLTAYAMAERYHVIVRVFNIFAPNALREIIHNPSFGSTIS